MSTGQLVVGVKVNVPSMKGRLYYSGPGKLLTEDKSAAVMVPEEEVGIVMHAVKSLMTEVKVLLRNREDDAELKMFDFIPFAKPC